jgi:Ni,Fe-hydrogenase maturation factor
VVYCLSFIEEGDILVILDASISGREPGTIWHMPLYSALNNCNQGQFQHDTDLLSALNRKGMQPPGMLICIEALNISQKWGLSQTLQSQMPSICSKIKEIILELRGEIKHA